MVEAKTTTTTAGYEITCSFSVHQLNLAVTEKLVSVDDLFLGLGLGSTN